MGIKIFFILSFFALNIASCGDRHDDRKLAGRWSGEHLIYSSAGETRKFKMADYGQSYIDIISDSTLDFSISIENDVDVALDDAFFDFNAVKAGSAYSYFGKYRADDSIISLRDESADNGKKIKYKTESRKLILETEISGKQVIITYRR